MTQGLPTAAMTSNCAIIDLTTPPPSPTARPQLSTAPIGSGHIICKSNVETSDTHAQQPYSGSDNEAADCTLVHSKRKAEIQLTQRKRDKGTTSDEQDISSNPDECVIVSAPPAPMATGRGADPLAHRATASASNNDDDDDEVTFVGRTGNLALFDFPHVREHCVANPWAPGASAALRCDNCWCYVCDAIASNCPEWSTHCQANNKNPKWRMLRTAWSKRPRPSAAPLPHLPQSVAAPAPAPALPRAPAQEPPQPSDRSCFADVAPPLDSSAWTAERVMQEIAQVYPLEEPEPEGLRASLRPYQKQSLAFMLNMERAPEDELLLGGRERHQPGQTEAPQRPMRGGWLCDETGMGKTCVCAALMLAQPTAPVSSLYDVAELRRRMYTSRTRSEIIIDGEKHEGYGSRSDIKEPSKEIFLMERLYGCNSNCDRVKPNPEWEAWKPPPTVHLGVTVVVTSNSLLGQWQDELRKFAPSLRVFTYHGSKKNCVFARLPHLDVVLTTPGTELFGLAQAYMSFDRLIIDESHGSKGKLGFLSIAARCKFIWGVTATPITSSIDDLGVVAQLLGQKQRLQSASATVGFSDSLVSVLRRLMIRHTKSQRIGGAVALSLPDADAETVWLEMDGAERVVYDALRPCAQQLGSLQLFRVENLLRPLRVACAGVTFMGTLPNGVAEPRDGAKTAALLADLNALRSNDAAVHAVVFTHHVGCYNHLRERVRAAGFAVCGFSGGDPVKNRWETIRSFQASINAARLGVIPAADAPAKVFIATVKVGSLGLTLTAATRVYLMEPCLDPSMEVQAAGRIHRLGQTKNVLVKRFCYTNSIDASVIELHDSMRRGEIVIANGSFGKAAVDLLLKDRSGG